MRRLRIQMRLRGVPEEQIAQLEKSPVFPAITEKPTARDPKPALTAIAALILFGGVVAPIIEAKLGLGGGCWAGRVWSWGWEGPELGPGPAMARGAAGARVLGW